MQGHVTIHPLINQKSIIPAGSPKLRGTSLLHYSMKKAIATSTPMANGSSPTAHLPKHTTKEDPMPDIPLPKPGLSDTDISNPISLTTTISGGHISTHAPLFTPDSSHLLCISNTAIRVFSVRTGLQVRSISFSTGSHSGLISAIALSPENPLQLYSASLDGSVRLWDLNDGALLNVWNLGKPITCFKIHSCSLAVVAASDHGTETDPRSGIYLLDMTQNTYQRVLKLKQCTCVDISQDGITVVATCGIKLHVGTLAPTTSALTTDFNTTGSMAAKLQYTVKWTQMKNDTHIVHVAIHPSASPLVVATGDALGKIKIWTLTHPPITQVFHWHARCVNQFAYTHDGRHLLSCGDEAVLIVWHVESCQRQYMPHLKSEIVSVSVASDSQLYALMHKDNSIRIVNATDLTVLKHIVGLSSSESQSDTRTTSLQAEPRTGHIALERHPGRLQVEPRTGHIALERHPGTLQIYDMHADCHVTDIEVVPWNYVAGTDIVKPRVMHTAFDPMGAWMATVDVCGGPKCTLRIWQYHAALGKYLVNTKIDAVSPVTGLAFRPNHKCLQLATCHQDGKFSVWEHIAGGWRCRASAYFRTSYVPQSVCWAADASVLAVGYGEFVTIWDPDVLALVGVLSVPGSISRWTHVQMGSMGSPYLAAVSSTHVCVWNLLDLSVVWAYLIPETGVSAVHLSLDQIVLVTKSSNTGSQINVFAFCDPVPVAIELVCEDVVAVVQCDGTRSEVVYMTPDRVLKRVGVTPLIKPGAKPGASVDPVPSKFIHRPVTLKLAPSQAAVQEDGRQVDRPQAKISAVMEGPCHAIPNVAFVFDEILKQMLQVRVGATV